MGASAITGSLTIADQAEGDVVVTFKKLNWRKLAEASRAREDEYYGSAVGRAVISTWKGDAKPNAAPSEPVAPKTDAQKVKALEDKRKARYLAYDRGVVFRASVTSLSIEKVKIQPWLDDLDETDAKRLHEAILDLSLPPIDPEEEEAERKND